MQQHIWTQAQARAISFPVRIINASFFISSATESPGWTKCRKCSASSGTCQYRTLKNVGGIPPGRIANAFSVSLPWCSLTWGCAKRANPRLKLGNGFGVTILHTARRASLFCANMARLEFLARDLLNPKSRSRPQQAIYACPGQTTL